MSFDGTTDETILLAKNTSQDEFEKKIIFIKFILTQDVLNSPEIDTCFVGRLIPTNKLKTTGEVENIRPIVALSLIPKMLEALILPKIKRFANKSCCKSQVVFMQECDTQINILKLFKYSRTELA